MANSLSGHLLYGRGKVPLHLPDDVVLDVLAKGAMPVELDPFVAVGGALGRPVACPPLEELAAGARTACIVICDITRPVPNGLFLRQLVERLLIAKLQLEDITILVATGLHRPNEGEELDELIGDSWVRRSVEILNHDARDDSRHADLGMTRRGTPVKLNRRFVESDVRIVTGLVEPHFMAGYSGGRKVIAPGIAHRDTITTFHNFAFMSDPHAKNCHLEGNPLHEEQLEIAKMVGNVYAVNTVINENRQLSFINFGEVVESHCEAVAFCEQFSRIPLSRRYRTVVTSAAGYPLDKTYYQTVKGIVGGLPAVADGGTLIIVSECSEGLGSPEFRAAQERLARDGRTKFLGDLSQKCFAAVDEWQTQMLLREERGITTILVTDGLMGGDEKLAGVEVRPLRDLDEIVSTAVSASGENRLALIPEGPYVVPVYSAVDPEDDQNLSRP